jgi:hypothetical protein
MVENNKNEKVLLCSAALSRQIKAHGWRCCRSPSKDYSVGQQEIFINNDNVYFEADVDDTEYQRELAKPICLSCITWDCFSYSATKRKTVAVMKREEILAVASNMTHDIESTVFGKYKPVLLLIMWLIFWPFLLLLWIFMPKRGEETDDECGTLHVASKRHNVSYKFQVPYNKINMVAESIMEMGDLKGKKLNE